MRRGRALAVLASSAAFAATPLRAQTREKLRVAFPALDATSEVMYAHDMGFFEKAGLDVELMPLVNGGPITSGVSSGAIDIGLGNALTVISAYKKGLPLTVVAPGAMQVRAFPNGNIVVAKTSPIQTAKDLNGKVVGVSPLRAIGEIAISNWADKNGGDASTLKFIEIPFSESAAMLASGRADAAFISEPFNTIAKPTTRAIGDPFASLGENWLITAFFTTRPWAQAHAATLARFNAVIRETAKWANQNVDLTAPILAKYTKMDEALIRTTVRARFAATVLPSQLQPIIDASAKYKLIDAPFPAADLIFQA
jgi:NitT/TauT family transport system substrate-binding protein